MQDQYRILWETFKRDLHKCAGENINGRGGEALHKIIQEVEKLEVEMGGNMTETHWCIIHHGKHARFNNIITWETGVCNICGNKIESRVTVTNGEVVYEDSCVTFSCKNHLWTSEIYTPL